MTPVSSSETSQRRFASSALRGSAAAADPLGMAAPLAEAVGTEVVVAVDARRRRGVERRQRAALVALAEHRLPTFITGLASGPSEPMPGPLVCRLVEA